MSGAIYWYICTQSAASAVIPTVASSQTDFNRKTANALAGLQKGKHAVGDLLARPIAKAIPNHLLCDGSEVSRTGFPQLFAEIGEEWGAGDGSTTFNLPNLIGTAPVATTAPAQVITGSTVSTGETVSQPETPAQTGGSKGGNVPSGGRIPRGYEQYE